MRADRLIPKMFHRRLALLLGAAGFASLILGGQMLRLAVVEGAERRRIAESRLDARDYLPTWRGRILDREGRELAVDAAGYDVAVQYSVISGAWVISQAGDAARSKHRARWAEMSPEEREAAYTAERPPFDHQVEQLWDILCALGGIERAELDRRLDSIRRRVETMAAAVWSEQRAAEHLKFGNPTPGEKDTFDPRPILEQTVPHVILRDVPQRVAFEFKRMEAELPGLRVLDARRREYPWHTVKVRLDQSSMPRSIASEEEVEITVAGVADHILGDVRTTIYAQDVDRRPFYPDGGGIDRGGYRPGVSDIIGSRGLEYAFEDHLRGLVGVVDRHMNTGEEERVDPEPGEDLHLTLDVRLQARIQAIMSPEFGLTSVQQWHYGWNRDGTPKPTKLPIGEPLNAAAAVIDVDTGDILAIVSMPTIAVGETWSENKRALEHPAVNRAVETPYPPGSIIKPLVLTAAVTGGVHDLDERIACTGHFFPHWKDRARCWIYREAYGYTTHSATLGHDLDAAEAISNSCNIYFYTLAQKLDAERLLAWYRRFGIGSILDAGLAYRTTVSSGDGKVAEMRIGEHPGSLPSEGTIADRRRAGQLQFDTIIMGIGQGPITWTPLHAANAYATLARGGYVRDATILANDPRDESARRVGDLGLDPRAVTEALEGLRQSVEEPHGTGHHISYPNGREPIINAENVTVWAKTGTAQAPAKPIKPDADGDGKPDAYITGLDHAWFVGLVGGGPEGRRRPQYAISVIVEYGGSGGRAAGPIANQIIRALQIEGYL